MNYFYELYEGLPRGGPGDRFSTRKAFSFMRDTVEKPLILDIGCGPGMQTIELAKISGGTIIALDNYQPFLDQLMIAAKQEGIDTQIITTCRSMDDMDFQEQSFDIIWSEGALYILGFEKGLKDWYKLLKSKGYLAMTEAVYLKPDPPRPVIEFWQAEYPDIKDIQCNIDLIEESGFELLSHFTLPDSSWFDDFYIPMEARIRTLIEKYTGNQKALDVFTTAQKEIKVFEAYSDYFGYEFFIMRKNE